MFFAEFKPISQQAYHSCFNEETRSHVAIGDWVEECASVFDVEYTLNTF